MQRLVLTLCLLLFTAPTWAATPTFDAASNSGVQSNKSSTAAYSHTAGTLTNGIAVIAVSSQDSTPGTISGVTYNAVAATQCPAASPTTFSTQHAISLWYKLNPPAGASAVVATFSEVMNSHVVSVVTYSNVNQASPIGTCVAATNFDVISPSEARVTVTSATGEVVVAIVDFASAVGSATTSQNSRASVSDTTNHFHGQSDAAGAATVDMSWTIVESDNNAILGVSLKPSSTKAGRSILYQ